MQNADPDFIKNVSGWHLYLHNINAAMTNI